MLRRLSGVPLVEVARGGHVESVHEVAACAVGSNGELLLALGDIRSPVYLRSAAKPFISATSVLAGVVEHFGLDQRELAVMTASHAGEPFHIEAVGSILRKIGMDESALQCGADYPYAAEYAALLQRRGFPAAPIYHNCSGKHAGILALCKLLGADPATYLDAANPAQQRILGFCASMSDVDAHSLIVGVDGCGIPVYAVPLRNAAISYMRFATFADMDADVVRALRIVRDAMIAYPEYMSGTNDFDAALIRAGGGSLVCKGGAEGVHATAAIERGAGIAVKVVDGAARARPPASIAALRAIEVLSDHQVELLKNFALPDVTNRAGRIVGSIAARRIPL